MKDPEDGDNVEKYSDNNEELSDGKERWSCPACCKQGRVTRSGSTSSTCGARSETTAPLKPDQSTPTDTLTLILNQLSTMASDIKDIKNTQSQLRTDVAYCRNLLQQHSDSISRHDDLIAAYETNIQNIQVTQTELSSNIANIESRLARSMETMHSGTGASSTPIAPSSQAETMELFRRSHNIILRGIAEGNDDINIVSEIIRHIEPSAENHRLSITRLGRTTSSNRLIRVVFSSPIIVSNILRKKNSILSHPTLRHVKISDDKTRGQMQELQHLREELRRRQTTGESNITIKYVRGKPSIVHTATQEITPSKN
ncbi:unnamed protein product [Acanthoscelides obtectus]|uniref:Uncharacterized protein n=1 Tax=Acanthoscelides obtectus TaxID=200917 RepID=A0A9P0LWG6_ACAOB|nr:unnamed protein product [Acanthoscelides obtectus]CAK1675449.1 hypothetical protein AOBTE_LOCUS30228 [Acanthoscelides obtectus]